MPKHRKHRVPASNLPMKSQAEIQRAHDILIALVQDELDGIKASEQTKERIAVSLDALCWILNHDDEKFSENLRGIEETVEAAGYRIQNIEGN